MTGFLMGSLAHTQVRQTTLIQIADLAGEYGVTFLIILVAASVAQFLSTDQPYPPRRLRSQRALALLPALLALAASLFYGFARSVDLKSRQQSEYPGPRIALIQGNTLADWKHDPDRQQRIMDEHVRLSLEAVKLSRERDGREVDLVIWPETSFREDLVTIEEGYTPPPGRVPPENLRAAPEYLRLLTRELESAVLVGIDRIHVFENEAGEPGFRVYNSSVLVDAQGSLLGTYDKMHRVVFGEYIPFANWFPVLYRLTPLTGGIEAGEQPSGLRLGDVLYAPNICYETAVPHLIRRYAIDNPDGEKPDLLVNLTNDAWYWGSSELDMHLACGVFRVVENRIPLVIAANGGLSAHIDRRGEVRQVSRRQQTEILLVDLDEPSAVPSFYAQTGDWLAGGCVVCCLVLAIVGWRGGMPTEVLSLKKTDDPARQ